MYHCKLFLLFSFTIINIAIGSVPELSPNTFLFCLKPELEPLEISLSRGRLSVGLPELDDFFQSHDVVKIEPWIKHATEMDRDGDIYLNRIYRAYLDENSLGRTDQSISSIQEFPFILYAEPEYIRKPYYTPNDPKYSNQCSQEAVKADLAWDYWDIESGEMPGDENILLASVDTGVDYTHPDLIENIWVNQGEIWGNAVIVDLIESGLIDINEDNYIGAKEINEFMQDIIQDDLNGDGYNNIRDALVAGSPFIDNDDNDGNGYTDDIIGWDASGTSGTADNDPFPKSGVQNASEWAHGTHVAGILAAVTDNGIGMASSMFNGKILSVKCSRDGSGEYEPPINDGYDGITYAAKAACPNPQEECQTRTIINCSWGGGGNNIFEQSVIDNAYNTYGAIVVAAAGNGDEDATGQTEEYAAHYPASYENVVSICAIACNGNWWNWATYHPTVDLAAPGEHIYSTIIGGDYEWLNGSSMASPNAASVMGLVWSYYPEWSNEDVVEQVKLAADPFIYEENPDYIDCKGNEGSYCLGAGMVDAYKAIGRGFSPNIQTGHFTFTEIIGDGDGLINPGETGLLTISLKNQLGWADADSIEAVLSTESLGITIHDANASYGNIMAGDSLNNVDDTYKIIIAPDIELGKIPFTLSVTGNSAESDYHQELDYPDIEVSLNQVGFPISTAQIRSSPLVIDLNGDGLKEIIFGDNDGLIHIFNSDGSEVEDETFPYNTGTGNQIWGSAASADLDNDGNLDFVIASKSKHLYIFDKNGLKTDYNANKYLMGTPAIGNLDDDDDLEVVIGGYSSSNQIFAINPDGSNVDGFPLVLGEKTKAGVALADFNGNGKDDIVCGTDNDNIYLIYDDATVAPGFPYTTGDKIQVPPSIQEIGGEKAIFSGSNDDNFYAIKSDGSLRFSVLTGDKVLSSPSFLEEDGNISIFFGSNDDKIYAVDSEGNFLPGWPIEVNGTIGGSVVFSDLDGDGDAEVLASTDMGEIVAFHLNGDAYPYFPIINDFPFSSSPMITDLDDDGDLEILAGSGSNLVVIDIKEQGVSEGYWSEFRGGFERRGSLDYAGIPLANIKESVPFEYSLAAIYPNPFNPVTSIKYGLPDYVLVKIAVYDILGGQVVVLINNYQSPGFHSVVWEASSYPSGLYFIRMVSNNITDTRKILLIK